MIEESKMAEFAAILYRSAGLPATFSTEADIYPPPAIQLLMFSRLWGLDSLSNR